MQNTTSKEKHTFYNSLGGVLKALENLNTIIDLRNESCVSGLIKNVDGNMNVEMENAIFFDPQGNRHGFEEFYINARNIRYVHIPKGLSSTELMENQFASMRNAKQIRQKPQKVKTFKQKRAQKYNEETKRSLENQPSTSKDEI